MVSTSKPGALQWAKGSSIVSRAGALLGTFALLLTSLVALPTVATAAQANSGITISDIALERVGGGENVTVGDKVKVSGNWDAFQSTFRVKVGSTMVLNCRGSGRNLVLLTETSGP